MGLVDLCVDDVVLDRVTADIAQQIAANSTHANKAIKELLDATDGMRISDGLAYELAHSPGACADARERVAAFGKKGCARPAPFGVVRTDQSMIRI